MEIFKIFLFFVTCRATSETKYSTTSEPTNTDRTNAAYNTTEYSDGNTNFIEYSNGNATFIENSDGNTSFIEYSDGNATYKKYPDGSNSNITKSIFYNLTTYPNFTRTSRKPFYKRTKTPRTTNLAFRNRTRTPYTRGSNTSYTNTISLYQNSGASNSSNRRTTPTASVNVNMTQTRGRIIYTVTVPV